MKILSLLFFSAELILIGMALCLTIYDSHLCCGKGADVWIYVLSAIACDLIKQILLGWADKKEK